MAWQVTDLSDDLALVRPRAKVLAREHRELKAKLVEIRRDARLTQGDIADRMGVSQQAVSKFEHYDSDPRLSTVRRYASAVGALIEHVVEVDRGQSVQMAASRSPWAQGTSSTSVMPITNGLQSTYALDSVPKQWVAAKTRRSDFALAR
ncbi:helix-turn-helix transcriptional regulator [Leucobacter sp. HY1910]